HPVQASSPHAPTPPAPQPPPVVPPHVPKDPQQERAHARIGDAVLALFARQDVLRRVGRVDAPAFLNLTSNAFLSGIGRATRIEAEIGTIYEQEGLQAAFAYIEARILPLWRAQEAKRLRQRAPRA
ncbi:MAG: hypothetical protein RLZZ142_1521, partial [Verrucomicrobiota bacterium]